MPGPSRGGEGALTGGEGTATRAERGGGRQAPRGWGGLRVHENSDLTHKHRKITGKGVGGGVSKEVICRKGSSSRTK